MFCFPPEVELLGAFVWVSHRCNEDVTTIDLLARWKKKRKTNSLVCSSMYQISNIWPYSIKRLAAFRGASTACFVKWTIHCQSGFKTKSCFWFPKRFSILKWLTMLRDFFKLKGIFMKECDKKIHLSDM